MRASRRAGLTFVGGAAVAALTLAGAAGTAQAADQTIEVEPFGTYLYYADFGDDPFTSDDNDGRWQYDADATSFELTVPDAVVGLAPSKIKAVVLVQNRKGETVEKVPYKKVELVGSTVSIPVTEVGDWDLYKGRTVMFLDFEFGEYGFGSITVELKKVVDDGDADTVAAFDLESLPSLGASADTGYIVPDGAPKPLITAGTEVEIAGLPTATPVLGLDYDYEPDAYLYGTWKGKKGKPQTVSAALDAEVSASGELVIDFSGISAKFPEAKGVWLSVQTAGLEKNELGARLADSVYIDLLVKILPPEPAVD